MSCALARIFQAKTPNDRGNSQRRCRRPQFESLEGCSRRERLGSHESANLRHTLLKEKSL
jgi:hypothetical protein